MCPRIYRPSFNFYVHDAADEASTPYFGDQIYTKVKIVCEIFPLFGKETDGLKKIFIFAPAIIQVAQMAKLVDALVSGTSISNDVQVRVLFWAQNQNCPG